MKIHILLHSPSESPGYILDWIKKNKHRVSFTKFYEAFAIPFPTNIDLLIIMGGPMSVNDDEKYSWLIEEKNYISQMITKRKKVLGICLGSQFIADALGEEVYDNSEKEIGWFDLYKNPESSNKLMGVLPDKFRSFHWHGQSYNLPKKCERLFSSDITHNQGFVFHNRIFAFQFHLETTPEDLNKLIECSGDDLTFGKHVQSPELMLADESLFMKNKKMLFKILDYIEMI